MYHKVHININGKVDLTHKKWVLSESTLMIIAIGTDLLWSQLQTIIMVLWTANSFQSIGNSHPDVSSLSKRRDNISFKNSCLLFTTWHSSSQFCHFLQLSCYGDTHWKLPPPFPLKHWHTSPCSIPYAKFYDEWDSVWTWMKFWLKFQFRQVQEENEGKWRAICVMCDMYQSIMSCVQPCVLDLWELVLLLIILCCVHVGILHQHKA